MLGIPKFKVDDLVRFSPLQGMERDGVIEVVDKWGTWENDCEVSYDIFVDEENMLYKHIPESRVWQE